MNWKNICLPPSATIREALAVLDVDGAQFAMIVDADGRLLGVATDGDIRRGLLGGHTLADSITMVMQDKPRTVPVGMTMDAVLRIMEDESFTHLPVLDPRGRVVSLWSLKELRRRTPLDIPMVLMVGGLGTRLGNLTRDTPKPMLPVGGQPMLEIILRNCMEWGLRRFYLAVNYKANVVENYFGDGSQLGCHIRYIRENKRMGTAGALSLLPDRPAGTLLVANGDVLTHLNFQELLTRHRESGAPATMAVRRHTMRIPYGVVERDADGFITGLREKPVYAFCVNAGVYALEPQALDHIPAGTFFDMPELFSALVKAGQHPGTYDVQSYWIDVGLPTEYQRAQTDFSADTEPI